jgi:hypothetical protein
VSSFARTLPSVRKEVRGLLQIWAPCVLTVAAGLVTSGPTTVLAGALATFFGLVTLGAQSFGHEYTYRTLTLLLTQPLDRRRLFVIKYGVLAAMTLMLALFAWRVRAGVTLIPREWREAELILLATASGLFVAPWLTMVCRSVLAGAVFTVAIPGLLTVGGDLLGALIYGLDRAAEIDHFKYLVLWRGMIAVCAVAIVAGWRTFLRLEAIEAPDPTCICRSGSASSARSPRCFSGDTRSACWSAKKSVCSRSRSSWSGSMSWRGWRCRGSSDRIRSRAC